MWPFNNNNKAKYVKERTTEVLDTRKRIGSNIDFASSEAYKLLRTNLTFTLEHTKHCNVFGVSSSVAGEGKSVTSINLAMSLAEMGKKVLLIEADMRKPVFERYFDIKTSAGLANCLAGLADSREIVYQFKDVENLSIISAGTIPPNPAELLSTVHLGELLDEYKKEYDIIMLDLPPVTVVADAIISSRFLQGLLIVVRDNYAQKNELAETIRQLDIGGVKILGFSYNVSNSTRKGYYKKDYKYYRRSYAYYESGSNGKNATTSAGKISKK